MTGRCGHRGAAPVGVLADLDRADAAAVLFFRMWRDGPTSRATIAESFAGGLGPGPGAAAADAFAMLCGLCDSHARRPLMRHALSCSCVGGDEACFASFVATAATGEAEDALLLATLMVRADVAPLLLAQGRVAGLALRRMELRARQAGAAADAPVPATRH